jgi:hypothetical protein
MKETLARTFNHDTARHVSGTDDPVIGLGRHAEPAKLPFHKCPGPRRIGDQDHRAAAGAETR